MTRRAPAASSWADTGRYTPPPKRERLRDLALAAASLRDGILPPPLVTLWLVRAFEELAEQLADGGRPNLHRLLDLPDRVPSRDRRTRLRLERDLELREIAAALPAELTPWQRARALAEILRDPKRPAPGEVRGYVAAMRAELLGKVPKSPRALHRIIVR